MHDTNICADESGCERLAVIQDLCKTCYGGRQYRGDLAPRFRRHTKPHSVVGQSDGSFWCATCLTEVKVQGFNACAVGNMSRQRLSNTGYTQEQYDLALVSQGNRCAVCGKGPAGPGSASVLHADHDHQTGKRRGLLCGSCNRGLGLLGDDPDLLIAAANYLRHGD